MKKNLFMVAAVLTAMVACNKEEVNNATVAPEAGETMEFTAYMGADTKATLEEGDGEAATHWEETDVIYVNGEKFTVKEGETAGESVTFVGPMVEAPYKAVFAPAAAGAQTHDAVEVSAAQTATKDALDHMVSVAYAEEGKTELEFKNVTSILKFTVAAACKTVTLTSDNALAGTVSIDGTTASEGTENTITVTGSFTPNETYYVSVLPGEKANFAVKVDDYVVKSADKVNITGSSIINMPLPYNIYLHAKTSKYDWTSDNARFAVWTWGTGVSGSWKDMEHEGQEGVYRLELPAGYENLIFCRMDPATTDNNWNNMWNQTTDLIIPSDINNHFFINSDNGGVWRDKDCKLAAKDGYLYLAPSSDWASDGARFAAYFFDNGETWKSMSDPDGDGIYEVQKPTDKNYPKVIFCRMNPSNTANNWDNKWNQTADLTVPTDGKNLYTYNNGTWDKGTGSWTKVSEF